MIHIPAKPITIPQTAILVGFVWSTNMLINTIHKGKIAPIMEPRPAEIYFMPHVLRPLLKTKFNNDKTISGIKSDLEGNGYFFSIKYNKYKLPANNCLMPASCNAGINIIPFLDTTQVVPHTTLTTTSAAKAKNPDPRSLNLCSLLGVHISSPFKASEMIHSFNFFNLPN